MSGIKKVYIPMEYYMPDYAEEATTRPLGYFFTNKEEAEKFVKEYNEKIFNNEVSRAIKLRSECSHKFIVDNYYVAENGRLLRHECDNIYVPATKEEIISVFISYDSDGYCILMELNSFEEHKIKK